jgi:Macrocin-O-methyltransferase (TylF)
MSDIEKLPPAIRPMTGEPWVELADGAALASWSREDEIAYNQANRQTEKYRFYVAAFDFLTENRVAGDYMEFGCHRARTFRMALTEARRHALSEMEFWAFDSFEGLPQASGHAVDIWTKGALATSEENFMAMIRAHAIYVERVRTVKGFYADSLNADLRARFAAAGKKAMMVNVDCDLYDSAVPVFDFVEPLLQEGTVVYVDDWFPGYKGNPEKGVARAFAEFEARSRFAFARLMDIGWWGRAFVAYLPAGR